MNNLLSYCGLVDAKIRASDKDLPVHRISQNLTSITQGAKSEHKTPTLNPKGISNTKLANNTITLDKEIHCAYFYKTNCLTGRWRLKRKKDAISSN
jgi:hypothetical protein